MTHARFSSVLLALFVGLVGSACGSVVVIEDTPGASSSSVVTTGGPGATTTSSSSSGAGGDGGGAPGCAHAGGVTVVGCGFEPNVVVVDADDDGVFVLDAVEDGAFLETLWRIDLDTFARTALFSSVSTRPPIDRVRSVARSGGAIYVVSLQDEEVIVRVPLDGGPSSVVVPTGVKPSARLAVAPDEPEGVWFESASGVARVDPNGIVTPIAKIDGVLMGAANGSALVASGDLIHAVSEGGGDTVFGPIGAYEAPRADLAGSLLVAPTNAGLGGIHELRAWYPDAVFTLATVPDGEGAGPPHFVKNAILGGEIPVVYFLQGTEEAGLLFMTVSGGTSGLFGETPPLGGAHLFRGPPRAGGDDVYVACARAADGADPALEGSVVRALHAQP